jgi:pyruvate carboxylase
MRGFAVQARVNMETVGADGSIRPGGGTLAAYEAPSGPGVRTDGFGYAGYRTSGAFDSLLAKVIAHLPLPDFAAAVAHADRALREFRIDGVATNIPFLHNILAHPDFVSGKVHTRWVDEHIAELARTVESRPLVKDEDERSTSRGSIFPTSRGRWLRGRLTTNAAFGMSCRKTACASTTCATCLKSSPT